MRGKAAENLTLLRKCFEAIASGDADALADYYTEDYVLELPYATTDGTRCYEGREAALGRLRSVFRVLRLELKFSAIHPSADPNLIIAEYTSEGTSMPSGEASANRYVGFWWFRNGRVCRTREYFNPELSVTKRV